MGKDPRRTYAWQKAQRRFMSKARRDGSPCALCGGAIDYDTPANTRWSPEVDHVAPLSMGGPLLPGDAGLRVAHKSCNSARGDGSRRSVVPRYETSRDWWA